MIKSYRNICNAEETIPVINIWMKRTTLWRHEASLKAKEGIIPGQDAYIYSANRGTGAAGMAQRPGYLASAI